MRDELKNHIEAQHPGATRGMRAVVAEIGASTANSTRELTTLKQMEAAAASPLVTFVRTADLPLKSDGVHFGRDAKLTIGRRCASVFLGAPSPFFIGSYRADLGRPVSAASIEGPLVSGFVVADASPGVLLGGIIEGGNSGLARSR